MNEVNVFGDINKMDPNPQSVVLKCLTFIEEQLIAVYRLKGGQNGYSGQIINFPQDVKHFAQSLLHSIDIISKFIFVGHNGEEGHKDCIVNSEYIRLALLYLIQNNPWYPDVNID